jgi:hypothetical protein
MFISSTSINHSWWVNEFGVGGVVTNNNPFIVCIDYNGTQRSITPNGGATTLNTPGIARGTNNTNCFIGKQPGNQWLNGGVGEVIVYNTALSITDRRQVEGYLGRKWGLLARLPVAHPYNPSLAMRPFELADVSAPALWLDATDASSFVFASGTSNILFWRDKSGNGRDASGVNNPIYSPSNVSLNGTTNAFGINLDFLAARSHMAFIVFSNTNFVNFYGALSSANNGTASLHVGFNGNTTQWRMNTWGNNGIMTITNYRPGRRNLAVFDWNATSGRSAFANGGQEGATVAGAAAITALAGGGSIGGNVLGHGRYQGIFNEIIMFTAPSGPALTAVQRQQIENHLMRKWTVNLPRLYTPPDVATCALWLDSADPTSMVLSGSNVSLWNDKSGNNRHAAPFTPPTWAGDGITFDGTSYMRASNTANLLSNAAYSLFLVETVNAGNAGIDCILGDIGTGGDNAGFLLGYVYNLTWFRYGYWGNDVDFTSIGGTGQRRLWSFNHPNTGNRYFNLYGTNVGTGTSQKLTAFQQLGIGGFGQGGYRGKIFEIIIYIGTLTATQIAQAEGYLSWKWGLQGNLPAGHLHRNAAPAITSLYRHIHMTPLFTPPIQSNCAVWLDGADNRTMTFSGNNITQWNDKSGNNRHAAAQGGSFSTYSLADYSLNNASPAYMICSNTANLLSNAAYTAFVVERASDVTPLFGDATFVDTATNGALHVTYASPTVFRWGYFNNDLDVTTADSLGSTRIWTFNQPLVANRNIRLNGTLVATHSNTTKLTRFGALSIMFWWGGAPISFAGKYFEFILYTGDVPLHHQERIEGYLAWKWKIQGVLPTTHPYRGFRP